MAVSGNLGLEERHRRGPGGLAQIVERKTRSLAGMHRRVALHVWQGKGALAIAAIGCSQQRKQSRVLGNRHQLTAAKRPSLGREVERKDANLSNKWVGHNRL